MFNLPSSKKDVYKEYFEKTGIQLTDIPISKHPSEVEEDMDYLYELTHQNPQKARPILEKMVTKYPKVAMVKNFLFSTYHKLNEKEKAAEIIEKMLEQHPDYLFSKTNKITSTHDVEELKKYRYLLGSPMEIYSVIGVNRTIHISEFTAYQGAVIHYSMMVGDDKEAKKRLQSLIDIEANEEVLNSIAMRIAISQMTNATSRLQGRQDFRKIVESRRKTNLSQTKKPPVFTHPEIEIFYQKANDTLLESEINTIMALPRASLIADLERVLEDGIRRVEYFQSRNFFDDNTQSFLWHSLYFLGALKAETSIEKVLDLLRMEEGFIDFWFSDSNIEVFYPVLYSLGENQLEVLKSYIKEEENYQFDRFLVSEAVSQIALHQPDRRAEVIAWYEDIYNHFLAHPDNTKLIDSDFIAFSVGHLIDIRAVEILPLIEKLYAAEWIGDDIQGNLSEITKSIKEAYHPSEQKPLPQDIYEYYSKEYNSRKVPHPPLNEDDKRMMEEVMGGIDTAHGLIFRQFSKLISNAIPGLREEEEEEELYYDDDDFVYQSRAETVVRTTPKVGRNNPCPCGSGKKYKKCCLKKK